MDYQNKTKDELIHELKKLQQDCDSIKESFTRSQQLNDDYRHQMAIHTKMITNIGDVVVIIDKAYINRYKSPNIEKYFGWKPEDLVGEHALVNVHPDDKDKARDLLNSLAEVPESIGTMECRYLCKDNSYKWIKITISNLIHDTEIKGFLGNYHDISDRKLAEEALKESDWKFRALFEKGPIGVAYHVMVNDANDKPIDYLFLDANDTYLELTGVDPRGRLVTEAFPGIEKDPFDWIGLFGKVARTGETIRFENYLESNKRWYDCVGYQYKPDHFVAAFLEITKRKQAELQLQEMNEVLNQINTELNAAKENAEDSANALKHSHDLMHYIIEHNRGAIAVHDKNYKYIYVSQRYLKDYKIEDKNIIGKHHYEVLPDIPQKWRDVHKRALAGEVLGAEEDSYQRDDGTLEWTRWECRPWYEADQSIGGFIVYTEIITPRKNMELELKAAKEKAEESEQNIREIKLNFETFFNTIDDFLFVLDEQANIIHCNKTVENRLGYTHEELIGKTGLFVHPEERRNEAARIVSEMLNGKAEFCPVPLITKQGAQIPVETRVKYGVWDGKTVLYGVSKDISKLKLSEEKFSEVFYLNPSACGLNDLNTGKYIEVNDAFYKLFGFTKEETIGHTATELGIMPPHTKAAILSKANSFGSLYNVEAELRAKNGDIKNVLISAKNIQTQDFAYRYTVLHDITEIKKAKEKAEESDRLKTAFLQNMSHEIRTPMNAICGFSDMLQQPGLTDEKRKNFVSIIQNSSYQLLSIVTDILTISSLETKQEKPNISKVCINNMIVELLSIFKQQSVNQNISLYAKKELTDIQSEVLTDRTKITQVLTNLLTNALKFTHEGFIEFGYGLTGAGTNLCIQFYVKDSGIGIKPEFHEKIFERFRQADKSIHVNYGGTGLGLSISKGFIELLGGKIWVHSEPGKGSTFYFTIPYKSANEVGFYIPSNKPNLNQLTVLVAEDEEYNFMYLEELLMGLGVKILHAKNGIEAVEMCKSNQNINLVLMDIKMPLMTGDKAAIFIKEFRPDLPIIAQSAYALEHEIDKFSGIFEDYVTKPIREAVFKQIVMKYIDKIS